LYTFPKAGLFIFCFTAPQRHHHHHLEPNHPTPTTPTTPTMSSLRNAMKRRTHKERSQPAKRRKRFGLLEKHKDYVQRAKNYRQKKGRIRVLKEKAETRNPDEFYFGMVKAKTNQGVYDAGTQGREESSKQAATMKLMRTQDASYVRMKASVEQNKIERLSGGLHFLHGVGGTGGKRPNTHTIFVDTNEEADGFDAAEHFQTLPEYVNRTFNRPRVVAPEEDSEEEDSDDASGDEEEEEKEEDDDDEEEEEEEQVATTTLVVHGDLDKKSVRRMRKKRDRRYQELGERLDREDLLQDVVLKMDEKKHLLQKGRRVQMKRDNKNANIEGGTKYYRWKSERKR
jgi:U3 small nucleolar RNA-associated protein 11